jgi:hypothetical protein
MFRWIKRALASPRCSCGDRLRGGVCWSCGVTAAVERMRADRACAEEGRRLERVESHAATLFAAGLVATPQDWTGVQDVVDALGTFGTLSASSEPEPVPRHPGRLPVFDLDVPMPSVKPPREEGAEPCAPASAKPGSCSGPSVGFTTGTRFGSAPGAASIDQAHKEALRSPDSFEFKVPLGAESVGYLRLNGRAYLVQDVRIQLRAPRGKRSMARGGLLRRLKRKGTS